MLPKDFDYRFLPIEQSPIELRALEAGQQPSVLVGYGVLWGVLSEDLGGFVERFERGAFLPVLGTDVCSFVDHEMGRIVGRTIARTLRLEEDDRGLRYEIDLANTTIARDLAENVRVGNIRGSSVAYQVPPEGERVERIDGKLVRTITKVKRLRDVSPTALPAFKQGSSITLRSIEDYLEQERAAAAAAGDGIIDTGPALDLRRQRLRLLELDV